MIHLTTLPSASPFEVPRLPGSPPTMTSDFALALAQIMLPAGGGGVAARPPDVARALPAGPDDERQALAETGTTLPVAIARVEVDVAVPAVPAVPIAVVPAPQPAMPASTAIVRDLPVSDDTPSELPADPVAVTAGRPIARRPIELTPIVDTVEAPADSAVPKVKTPPAEKRDVVAPEAPAIAIDVAPVVEPNAEIVPAIVETAVAVADAPAAPDLPKPIIAAPSAIVPTTPPTDAAPAEVAFVRPRPSPSPKPAREPLARRIPQATPAIAPAVPAPVAQPPVAVPTVVEPIGAKPVGEAPLAPTPLTVARDITSPPTPAPTAADTAAIVRPGMMVTAGPAPDAPIAGMPPATRPNVAVAPTPAPAAPAAASPISVAVDSPLQRVPESIAQAVEPPATVEVRPVAPSVPADRPISRPMKPMEYDVPVAEPGVAIPAPMPVVAVHRAAPPSVQARPVEVQPSARRVVAAASIDATPVAADVDVAAVVVAPSAPISRAPAAPVARTAPHTAIAPATAPAPPPALDVPAAPASQPTPPAAPAVATSPAQPAPPPGAVTKPRVLPDPAPITVVVAAPAPPPPIGLPQPAAQLFAAAIFAADRLPEPDRDDPASDLAAAFPLSAPAAPVAGQRAPEQRAPAIDLARGDWMNTMIERIETLQGDGGARETRIRLAPDALGAVDVSIHHDGGGIQVRLAADTPQARAILAEAAPRLAEMAEARGLKLGGAAVDPGNPNPGQQGRDPRQPEAPLPVRPAPAVANDDDDTVTDTRIA